MIHRGGALAGRSLGRAELWQGGDREMAGERSIEAVEMLDIPPRLRGGWTREARPGGVLAGASAVPRKRPHPGPPRRRGGRSLIPRSRWFCPAGRRSRRAVEHLGRQRGSHGLGLGGGGVEMAGERFDAVDRAIPPRLRGGWTREARPGGVLARASAAPRKRPHPGPPRRRGGRSLIPRARWFCAGCSPVTASGRTPRPTARRPWPRPWRRRRRDGGRALPGGGRVRISLPVFGEGGRAKRGRVGFLQAAAPCRGKDPTPALPEDGEGEGLIPRARWFWAGCSPVTASGRTPRPTARRPWPRPWRRRRRDGG